MSKAPNLTLQLDLYYLEWLFALVLRQVSKSIHVLHRPSLSFDVLTLSIRVGRSTIYMRAGLPRSLFVANEKFPGKIGQRRALIDRSFASFRPNP